MADRLRLRSALVVELVAAGAGERVQMLWAAARLPLPLMWLLHGWNDRKRSEHSIASS